MCGKIKALITPVNSQHDSFIEVVISIITSADYSLSTSTPLCIRQMHLMSLYQHTLIKMI